MEFMESDVNMNDVEFMETDEIDNVSLLENKCDKFVYIDVQGFITFKNRFMCKEFCLVDGDYIFHTFVKSPYSFKKMPSHYQRKANWLTHRFHGIQYECGDINILELREKIFPEIQGKTILVKGLQKVRWLEDIFHKCGEIDCKNIEDTPCDLNLRSTEWYEICDYHKEIYGIWNKASCAKSTALMLQDVANNNANTLV